MKPWAALLILAIALGAASGAWSADKPHRVGVLTSRGNPRLVEAIAKDLGAHGYKLGQNLIMESRDAGGKTGELPNRAKELVGVEPDVIVTLGYAAAVAAKNTTATIPLVVTSAGDPVETGLVASLSRPGGNLTGISDMAAELSVKRLDLLQQAVPNLKRVAMLWNADDLGMTTRYKAAAMAAGSLGIAVQPLGVREPDDFEQAFAAMESERPDGILMVTDALTVLNRKRVFEFARAHRIPAIYEFDFLVRDGGLMSYGPDEKENNARVADLVDRILKGARPAELPFEQPTQFKFVVNLDTAKSLGLTLPASLLDRADEVIE